MQTQLKTAYAEIARLNAVAKEDQEIIHRLTKKLEGGEKAAIPTAVKDYLIQALALLEPHPINAQDKSEDMPPAAKKKRTIV